jgi:CHASE2 domain-containing sensor protein
VTIGNFPATQAVSLASVPTHGVTLASTTVTVSALPRPTWTNYSGTVTTANTAITAISTTTRTYLLAQVTTGQMFINIGATATSINSVYFSAGQGFAWETSVPQGIVSIISGVTGTNYVLKEG